MWYVYEGKEGDCTYSRPQSVFMFGSLPLELKQLRPNQETINAFLFALYENFTLYTCSSETT